MAVDKLPNFVGVGCRRCASSWVHRVLNAHPEVGKNAGGDHFFSDNWSLGKEWYQSQHRAFMDKRVVVDFSVSYSYPEDLPKIVERMHECLPDAKLFMLVRNPVERANSDYLRSIRMGELPKRITFPQACAEHPELLERGFYGRILQTYLKHFEWRNMLMLFYDDLMQSPDEFLGSLFSFLGVNRLRSDELKVDDETRASNLRSEKVNTLLRGAKTKLDSAMHVCGAGKPWANLKARGVGMWRGLLSLNYTRTELSDSDRKEITPRFKEDVGRLAELTGRDLSHWLK